MDFDAATCRFNAFGIVCALLTSPAHQDVLMEGPRRDHVHQRRLAARRPTFGSLVGGIDRVATLSFDNGAAPESRKAALRVVQTGGAITQSIAARWVHGGKTCPYCKLAIEDVHHRFWACPRWYHKRTASLGTYTRRALVEIVGEQPMLTGIFPSDPALLAAQRAAEAAAAWPQPIQLPAEVWTDGSCIMPTDPLLRRAAWAVVGYPERGYPTLA